MTERDDFETAYRKELGEHFDPAIFKRDLDGEYFVGYVASAWWAWQAAVAVPEGWIPVGERMPDALKPVMASYTSNYDGKSRTIRARWVAKLTQESEDIDDFDAQYDEETDTYYDHEGWYELIDNWGEYSSVAVTEGEVTHWQPLPAAPKQENKP